MPYKIIKRFKSVPAAHRQPKHPGHCSQIHGHNWVFEVEFTADTLDSCGFVVDVGKLRWIQQMIDDEFDHRLILNENDPLLMLLEILEDKKLAELTIVPDCSMEGLAKYLHEKIMDQLEKYFPDAKQRGLRVTAVICYEDERNWCRYEPNRVA